MKRFPTHIVAVFGVVENANREVLLLKHRYRDIWMFPGGQVEVGENLIEALVREAREESGMEIEPGHLFCITSNTCTYPGYDGYDTVPSKVIMGFACTYKSGDFGESDETTEHIWVARDRVLDYVKMPDFIDKYKAYLEFDGTVRYLSYVTKPNYSVDLETTL